jgi:DNA polymerase III epsilon subunit
MRWTDCRVVAFDTETTGLNPFDGDRIIEFGAVELTIGPDGRVQRARPHQFFINPEIPIPRTATRVSGITDDDVKDAPLFRELAPRIRAVLQDAVLIAHNFAFDFNFLRAELRRAGSTWPLTRAEVDTLPLGQRLLPELDNHKLETLCARMEVPLDNAHRASNDAEACGRMLAELARRHGAPVELEGFADWADAICPPPDTGHLRLGSQGVVEFVEGERAGRTIEQSPDHLQWMTMARVRRDGRWQMRYPDSVVAWARKWLRVRGSGRMRANPKGGAATDWSIDPPAWTEWG